MAETAACLADPAVPRLPIRQRVLSLPKRLRSHLPIDLAIEPLPLWVVRGMVDQPLRGGGPAAGPRFRMGVVTVIHRFGTLLNPQARFHCLVIEGVFEAGAAGATTFCESRAEDEGLLYQVRAKSSGVSCAR